MNHSPFRMAARQVSGDPLPRRQTCGQALASFMKQYVEQFGGQEKTVAYFNFLLWCALMGLLARPQGWEKSKEAVCYNSMVKHHVKRDLSWDREYFDHWCKCVEKSKIPLSKLSLKNMKRISLTLACGLMIRWLSHCLWSVSKTCLD